MNEPVRLAKRVAALVPCSRSEAEQYIEGGWVRVDGQVVEEPQFRVLHQQVSLDPGATLMAQPPVTLLLHKPAGQPAPPALLNAATHWPADPAAQRVLKRHFQQLTPLLPLEDEAGGLVAYSQDWRVVRKLTQDAHLVEVEFMVEVRGAVPATTLPALQRQTPQGLQVKASLSSSSEARSLLRFALKGARAGLIADLCARAGLQVLAMKRLRIGRVALAQLPPGQWRYLQPQERF